MNYKTFPSFFDDPKNSEDFVFWEKSPDVEHMSKEIVYEGDLFKKSKKNKEMKKVSCKMYEDHLCIQVPPSSFGLL
jgi:hypothetical protein